MPHPVEFLAEAAGELIEARLWYHQRDPEVALRFSQTIDTAIDIIAA